MLRRGARGRNTANQAMTRPRAAEGLAPHAAIYPSSRGGSGAPLGGRRVPFVRRIDDDM
jgi:hypothetical protein